MVKQFRSRWTLSQLYAGKGGINPQKLVRDTTCRNNVKDLMKTSIGGMAGLGALGAINQVPGMPKNNVSGLASTGVNLAILGDVTRLGMNIIPKHKKKKSK